MFARDAGTFDLVSNTDVPPEQRTVLTFRKRINLEQQGKLYADDAQLRAMQDGSLMVVQQLMLYMQAYLVAWAGPDVPRDEQGVPLPVRDDLIAELDYRDPFVYQALQTAERLYCEQFLNDPAMFIKKKAVKPAMIHASPLSLTAGEDGSTEQ